MTSPQRLRALAIASLAAVLIALVLARPAGAGDYVATQCSALNPSPGAATWERTSTHYVERTRCNRCEGLQVVHDAESTDLDRYGAWVWRAPAGTVFTTVQVNASLTNQAGHHAELWASHVGGGATQFGGEHEDFGIHSIAGELVQFSAMLRCAAPGAGGRCGRAGEDSAHAYVKGIFARVEDRAEPALSIEGGSLLADPVVRGERGLLFSGSDVGSGIRKVYVEANGSVLVTDIRNCAVAAGYATALEPCPPATSESAGVPTTDPAFATGPNTVTACVEDLALDGAPNRACEQRSVWVDNVCPGSPPGGATELSAAFAADGSGLTRSDERAVVRGRLVGPGGPIAGATVCALTQTQHAGAPVVLATTATTGAAGAYALELAPGPSRDVFVHHAAADAVIARHGLTVRSIARPTLDVRPRRLENHDRLHFSGVLPGPACFNRVVKVQARVGKHRWRVFRTDRADEGCAFAARYKLRATREARRYRFRALVPQQAGYPYERGHSPTAKVEVER